MDGTANISTPLSLKRRLRSFHATDSRVNPENALFLATAAACAYQSGGTSCWARNVFADEGFSRIQSFRRNWRGSEGFAMSREDATVVAFAGTNDVKDWFTNMDTRLKRVYDVHVHNGFWQALNIIWVGRDHLYQRLKKEAHMRPLWFTGHSLGGALAIIAALRCIESGIPVQGVYTFGQPLVGEGRFRAKLDTISNQIHRYVNEADPIPLVPFLGEMELPRSQWKTRWINKRRSTDKTGHVEFENAGMLYWFNAEGALVTNATYPTRSVSMIEGLYKIIRGSLQLPQHDLQRYLDNIEAILPHERHRRSVRRERSETHSFS